MTREELEKEYGTDNVWNTAELQKDFIVESFLAPYAFVQRISDGAKGWVGFTHNPRYYFDFKERN